MNISGNNFINISNQTGLSFILNSKFFSTTGSGEFGFRNVTGTNANINFRINRNNLYDPSGRYVYNINNNKNFEISGSINTTGYSYFINNNEVFYNNNKNNFQINNFYYNLTGISGYIEDFKIYGDPINFIAEMPNYLYSNSNITGTFRNLSNRDCKLLRLDIQHPNFQLVNNPYGTYTYTQGKNFVLSGKNIQNYLQLFNVPLLLTGDFGERKIFIKITGFVQNFSQFSLNLYEPQVFNNNTTEINDEFYYTLYSRSINYAQNPASSNNRTINLALDYVSGYTGTFNTNLTGSGNRTINFSGVLNGSGYLSTGFNLILTGQNIYINNNKDYSPVLTGSGFFNINELFYITGKNLIQNVTGILGSGLSGGVWLTGLFNTRITGDTDQILSGYITYATMSGSGNVSGRGISGDTSGLGLTGFIDQIVPTGLINTTFTYSGSISGGNLRPSLTGQISGFFTKTFDNTFHILTGFYHDSFGNHLNTNSIAPITNLSLNNRRYSGIINLTGDVQFIYLNIYHYNVNNSGMIARLSITGTDAVNSAPIIQTSFITGNF